MGNRQLNGEKNDAKPTILWGENTKHNYISPYSIPGFRRKNTYFRGLNASTNGHYDYEG